MADEPWYKPNGVLTKDKHAALVAMRETVTRDAGIPMPLLWKPLPDWINEGEREWLRKFKTHRDNGYCGLLLTGEKPVMDPLSHIRALAECLRWP